jgi:hypothetical protein
MLRKYNVFHNFREESGVRAESGVIVELDYIEPPLLNRANRANWEAKTDIVFIAVGRIACCCC